MLLINIIHCDYFLRLVLLCLTSFATTQRVLFFHSPYLITVSFFMHSFSNCQNNFIFSSFFFTVYVGDLKPIFTAFSGLALPGDFLIFTIENKDIDESNIPVEVEVGADVQAVATPLVSLKEMKKRTADWILQKSGRFAHSKEYVKKVIKSLPNLSIVTFQDIVPRYVRTCVSACFYSFSFFLTIIKCF